MKSHSEMNGRPVRRADCENKEEQRPCPYVSCAHHLALDVSPLTGEITTHLYGRKGGTTLYECHLYDEKFLDDLVERILTMSETCVLDMADQDGCTLEQLGQILNLTRERIRQIEANALRKLGRSYSARQALGQLIE